MNLIVTRPEHDSTTKYISAWAQEVITTAYKKGIEVIDLLRDKACRKEFEGRLKKLSPKLVFLNGHGNETSVTGHDNEVLVEVNENEHILKGRITYALSCSSGKLLGPALANEEMTAYIGYSDEFSFVYDRRYISKPIEDPLARPFMESSNQLMVSLIKGHTAEESTERAKEIFKKHCLTLSSSNATQDDLQVAKCLWWNMNRLVCSGNQAMTIAE